MRWRPYGTGWSPSGSRMSQWRRPGRTGGRCGMCSTTPGSTCCWSTPANVKQVPGRKTDVNDAVWLAELPECGLLAGSFVPPPVIRELRDLTRYRKRLIQDRTREAQRVDKVLQDAAIKLGSVASQTLGTSSRAMIEALIAGERDPEVLADLAKRRLRVKIPDLVRALHGRFRGAPRDAAGAAPGSHRPSRRGDRGARRPGR
jgi:transposase